jgi:hypothetical protein
MRVHRPHKLCHRVCVCMCACVGMHCLSRYASVAPVVVWTCAWICVCVLSLDVRCGVDVCV